MTTTLLAINWEPELRGVLTVIIGLGVLMGSIYLLLGTNLGARLGFMVAFAGLAGWMALMAGVWWIYGIGLKGDAPEWKQVEGRTVIQQVDLLYQAGVIDHPLDLGDTSDSVATSKALASRLEDEGWRQVDSSEPQFGQAEAAATVFLEEEEAFAAGEFQITSVFEIGGEAYPKLFGRGELDQIAFLHHPYFTLVEVAPLVPLRDEPGRAPTAPEVDTTQPRQFVYMVRDLGSLRQPAAYICIGSTIVFLSMCFLLHRRDRFAAQNLSRKAAATA